MSHIFDEHDLYDEEAEKGERFRPDDPPASHEPPTPEDGGFPHGSHVAGIAAGISGVKAMGVEISGVAPRAWLMNYKIFYYARSGKLNAYTPEIVASLEDALADGADIVNGSWGGVADYALGSDPMILAAEALVRAGVVTVFAAGNEGPNRNTIDAPAASPLVIAVANTMESFVADLVNQEIQKGWKPQGGMAVAGIGIVMLFYQAMVKEQ